MPENVLPLDSKEFRRTIGLLATGVTVIITAVDGRTHAMTASAVTSLSLEPMALLICINKNSKMADFLRQSGHFSVNILAADQEAVSNHFAGARKGDGATYRIVDWAGGKQLEGALASLQCLVTEMIEGGDHLIVIGQIEALNRPEVAGEPLVVYGGSYHCLTTQPLAPAPEWFGSEPNIPHIFYDPWESR